jgi:hypothetical protein
MNQSMESSSLIRTRQIKNLTSFDISSQNTYSKKEMGFNLQGY